MTVAEIFVTLGLVPDQASWDKGHELIEGLHTALTAYLGYEGLKKVKELVDGTVEAAVSAKHLGERLGITGEAVQELGYAADVTGASSEDMTSAMQRLAAGMEHAKKNGTGPLVDGLSALKVHMSALKGENLEQNLETIADGFKNAGPGVNKLGVAIEIFGRNAGPKLLPLLNKGADGIQELREEAQKLGVVIDEDGIAKAEEFEIAQKKLGATLKGVRNEAVVAMLPALQEMADSLSEWVAQNREAIASTLKAVIEGLAFAFHAVGVVISTVVDVVGFLGDNLDLLISIVAGLAAVLLPFLEEWADEAALAAGETLAAAAPFIAIGVAVAALTYGIIQLVKHWDVVWTFIEEKAKSVADWFASLPGKVADWVGDVADSIEKAFSDAWDAVVQGAKDAWEKIKDLPVIGHIIRGVQDVAGDNAVSDAFKQATGTSASTAGSPSVPSGTEAGTSVNLTTGDNNITINGTDLDPKELQAAVKVAVSEGHQDLVRQAYTNLSGGKR